MGFRTTEFLPVDTTYGGGTSSVTITSEPVVGGSSGNPEPPVYLGPEIVLAVEGGGPTSTIKLRSSDGVDFVTVDPSDNAESKPKDRLRAWQGIVRPVGRDWAALPLLNSWTAHGGQTLRVLRDAAARVELHGRISGGTSGVIADLALDLAPEHLVEFVCKSNGDASTISWVHINARTHATAPGRITVVSNVAAAQTQLSLTIGWSCLGANLIIP